MFRNRPVSLALVGLFVWVTGCTSYKQIELGAVSGCDHVQVYRTDGGRLDFYGPIVQPDSIQGWVDSRGTAVHSVSLDRVAEVKTETTNTVLVVTVGVLFTGVSLLALAQPCVGLCY